ncbi:MAG TPA: ASKHA domain-containing protein [Anaerolineae bacterium]|nr:ASKHA domain-containing protein [Anaerolineae bacterium]
MYRVTFEPSGQSVEVPEGTLLSDAIARAGVAFNLSCGGQGRCGRCQVIVRQGQVRRRSELRLSREQVAQGYALACQTVIESDLVVEVPSQELVAHTVAGEKAAATVAMPDDAGNWRADPFVTRYSVEITPPSLDDNTNDWDRLQRELAAVDGIERLRASLPVLRGLGQGLRDSGWQVDAVMERGTWEEEGAVARLLDLQPRGTARLLGAAIDIGTTSNVVYLVDMAGGQVLDTASTFNGQISCGEDVISRIIYARRNGGLSHLQELAADTLNQLLDELCRRNGAQARQIVRLAVAGNTTMIHLFLGIDPQWIRLEPYIPTVNQPLPVRAVELGLHAHPEAQVDCLPSVGAYVGADITAGVLSSEMCRTEKLTLFIDVGTNGEIVLGNADWLISCACSAGPAFEGAGVQSGMRAVPGAIDEVWINPRTYEPTIRTIGDRPARGICGSGMISALAEMFLSGVIDKAGRLNRSLNTPRIRDGEHGPEYLFATADQQAGVPDDVVLTEVDIANLLRAKGAIYAGFSVLTRSVGISLADVEQVLIGGSFGKYINIEKAITIGLLPDMPWERFRYLGNTSVRGAYQVLLSRELRRELTEIAQRMTYLELSADNSFMEEFTSALFLPHTDETAFPSVAKLLRQGKGELQA